LLVMLFHLTGGSGVLWWLKRGKATASSNEGTQGADTRRAPVTQRSPCSDDDDPKVLEPLEFGTPISVRFDRSLLDSLAGKPIPPVEVYPWQPEGLVAVLGEHRMRGNLFTVSPAGKTIAVSSSGDAWIRLGSSDTLHEKQVLVCPGGTRLLAWAPMGDRLAVSTVAGPVLVFDARDMESIGKPQTLEKPTGPITALSWSSDGKYLLGGDSTHQRGVGCIWEVLSGKLINRLLHSGAVTSVAFSPVAGDYRMLTAGGVEDGSIHLWDSLTAKSESAVIDFRPAKTDTTVFVGQVAFAPDGKRALSCHPNGSVRLWDLARFEKGKESQTLVGHQRTPLAAFAPDGRTVVTAPSHNKVCLWNARDGKQIRPLASASVVHDLRFLSTGDSVIFAGGISSDANLHIHEVKTGKEVQPPVGHLGPLSCVAFAPEGASVATGSADQTVRVWDLRTVQQRHAVVAGQVWGVDYQPDGKRIFHYGSTWGTPMFADIENGKTVPVPYERTHAGAVWSASITRDGLYLVSGGYRDGFVRMYRLADGKQVREFMHDGPARVSIAPDMRRAIRTGGTKTLLLHLRCQEVVQEWDPASWALFLPDGRSILLGGSNTRTFKISAKKVEPGWPLPMDLSGSTAIHLAPDGKRVAAVAGRVTVFDIASGKSLWTWTPPGHFYGVRGVALSAGGEHLLTANGDGTAYVIRLPKRDP
jgi:WD40 repeat protein